MGKEFLVEITWLGVAIAVAVTAAIVFSFFIGKEVGKDKEWIVGYEQGFKDMQTIAQLKENKNE